MGVSAHAPRALVRRRKIPDADHLQASCLASVMTIAPDAAWRTNEVATSAWARRAGLFWSAKQHLRLLCHADVLGPVASERHLRQFHKPGPWENRPKTRLAGAAGDRCMLPPSGLRRLVMASSTRVVMSAFSDLPSII